MACGRVIISANHPFASIECHGEEADEVVAILPAGGNLCEMKNHFPKDARWRRRYNPKHSFSQEILISSRRKSE